MTVVAYAETFGAPSEPWLHRQVAALGLPLITHEHTDPAGFPHDPVHVVPRAKSAADRLRGAARAAKGAHRYRLPRATEQAVAAQLRDLGATVVHAHFGPAGLRVAPAARAAGAALVVTFHGFDASELLETDPRYGAALRELAAQPRTRFVAVSRAVAARLPAPAEVVPLGVDLPPPPPTRAPRDGPARALTVARLVPKKGVPDLVDAAAAAGVALDIAGDGPERDEVRRRAGAGVTLHGAVPPARVAELLAAADLFALNSRTAPDGDREGLPVSILEAMAAGLPVVATDHSGIPEAVVDGETGLLVPERDTDALAAALRALAADPARRARFGAAGRARAEREFDAAAARRRLRALYAELA